MTQWPWEIAMQVYLLRHGIAESHVPGHPDAARTLTPDGRKKLRAVLIRARAAGAAPTLILSSPYVRAKETAALAMKLLAPEAAVLQTSVLEPGADPRKAWDEIRLHKDHPQILCASHEPLCSQLAAFLLGSPALQIDFKKGALLRVDMDGMAPQPHGVLRWMLSPRLS